MPIATTTALLLGAGIAGGTSLAAGKMASGAAKDAAETQSQSADKALALQSQMYQQERADTAVSRNAANQATTLLSGLMGIPSGPVAGPTGVPDTIGPPPGAIPDQYGRGFGLLKPGVTPEQALDPNFQYDPAFGASGGTIGSAVGRASGGGASGGAIGRAIGSQAPPQQNASSYVQMRAPTGEVQPVPADQVAHFEQMGARRV